MTHPFRFYAIVLPGLEPIAMQELEKLSVHEIRRDHGGIHFAGTMETMFRVNLRSRCITRVLMRLRRFTAMSLETLHQEVKCVEWTRFLNDQDTVSVHASCSQSRLIHSTKVEQKILQVLQGAGFNLDKKPEPTQQVFIRIENNRCTLSLDTSGERLDRRGYRLESGKAPVRETIAAGILQWMQWTPDEPLIVPMSGSGTFAIEAAMLGRKMAPGIHHDFPFSSWPSFHQKRWQRLFDKTKKMSSDVNLDIQASDLHTGAIGIATRNTERAGLADIIQFEQRDIKDLKAVHSEQKGLIICNPPYGERIGGRVKACYREVGALLQRYPGFRMAVLSPNQTCEKALGMDIHQRLCVTHGGKSIHVLAIHSLE
ncbi:MAG: RNA methyltransferase [Mariprofundaceae bacterium]